MITYDKKQTRANRHSRKVTLRLPILRQVRFFVNQKAKNGFYLAPVITMVPSTFSVQAADELGEWRVALTRAYEIYKEMSVHTGTKARGSLKGGGK